MAALQDRLKTLQSKSSGLKSVSKKAPYVRSDYMTPSKLVEEYPQQMLLEEIEVLRAHVSQSVEQHYKAAKLLERETSLLHKQR